VKQRAEGVKASLGETCKVAPIRTSYPKGDRRSGNLDSLACRETQMQERKFSYLALSEKAAGAAI